MKKVLITLLALATITGTLSAQDTLRVMTYNLMGMKPGTDHPTRLAYAIQYLKGLNPHIIGMQEINETLNSGGADNQAKTIADSLGAYFGIPYHRYMSSTHLSWNNQYREYVAIISKYPIEESAFLNLVAGAFPRKVLWSRILTPGGPVNFFNTHVDYLNSTVRTQQVAQIIGFMAQKDSAYPAVATMLTGDFNDTPGSAPLLQLTNTGTDTFFVDSYNASNPTRPGYTVPSNAPTSRIDYIWHKNTGRLSIDTSFVVMNQPYPGFNFCSDHLGVMTTFTAEVTDIQDDEHGSSPEQFGLYPNYPNPFNPTTIINYQLPITSHVLLRVYNFLGQEVATLVDTVRPAGRHEVRWDASGMPGGVYIVRLLSNDGIHTRSIMLIK